MAYRYSFLSFSTYRCSGLMIVDGKGILRVKHINDFPLGRNVEEALRLVEAINFADTHGEGMRAYTYLPTKLTRPSLSC